MKLPSIPPLRANCCSKQSPEIPLESGKREAENDATTGVGSERTMYVYAPVAGCPDSKQCQVLMVLRNNDSVESALEVMTRLELDKLAEEKHFLLLFPNPMTGGWNYENDPTRENDMHYLVRCFAALRASKCGINGFNGIPRLGMSTFLPSCAVLMKRFLCCSISMAADAFPFMVQNRAVGTISQIKRTLL